MGWADWIEHHLLPCPSKAMFGMDCPGCGIQRAMLELMRGNFIDSLKLYPALLPILLLLVFMLLHIRFKFKSGAKTLQYGYLFSAFIIVTSYIVKQIQFYNH